MRLKMKWFIVAAACILSFSLTGAVIATTHSANNAGELQTSSIYEVNLTQWSISNNGTNPKETTDGINAALEWAKQEGYTTFSLPAGIYSISKDSHIVMVSDMTFLLDSQAVLKKEANAYPEYKLLYLPPGTNNVTLRGGTYEGDKNEHQFSGGGTHEHGYGIVASGVSNLTVDQIKAINFTGDGMSIGKMGTLIRDLYANHFESGSVSDQGTLQSSSTHSRVTHLPVQHHYFDIQRTFQFIHARNLPAGASAYTVYFYKEDDTFIGKLDSTTTNTPVGWGLSDIPEEAAYFHAVFPMATIPSNLYIEYWMQGVSHDVLVTNSEFAHNRRQGITVGGARDVMIQNSVFHDMKGAAPESGIDLEAGYNLNNHISIVNNSFYNNKRYDLILYDGRNAYVEGNHFASKHAIGLAISEPFKYAEIVNNHFDGSQIYAYNYADFDGNRMNDGLAAFLGENLTIRNMEFTDTLVNLSSSSPFGIEVSDITVYNTKKQHTGFGVHRNPLHLNRVSIYGEAALDSLTGNATDGSIFDHLKIIGFNRTQLPRGTYNHCELEATTGPTVYGGFEVNNSGTYEFNDCTFTSQHRGFDINGFHGTPDYVSIQNSTFTIQTDRSSLTATQVKELVLKNNVFHAPAMKRENLEIIYVGNYWVRAEPTKLGSVTIEGNQIHPNLNSPAISTIYAGVGAEPYIIKNNTLPGARLLLKENDIQENNVE